MLGYFVYSIVFVLVILRQFVDTEESITLGGFSRLELNCCFTANVKDNLILGEFSFLNYIVRAVKQKIGGSVPQVSSTVSY